MKRRTTSIFLSLILIISLTVPAFAAEKTLKAGSKVNGFTVTEMSENKLYDSELYILKHDKTGARVLYIANDDTNRAFDIAFRTPASDTGVSHVFEHATLAGSEKYPADIFFNVGAQTINTYMNAYTATDHTAYPLSSISDEQLLSLADYYLDGVFNPLILTDKSMFDQEAWRYELDSPDGELKINGTVYSEMKGSVTPLVRASFNTKKTLFPGSNRAAISGGDPDIIPSLTYEETVGYHSKYYKPSNSLSILYGDVSYKEYLELLDSYFKKYDNKTVEITDSDYKEITGNIEQTFKMQGEEGDGELVFYAIPCDVEGDGESKYLSPCVSFLNSDSSILTQAMNEEFPAASIYAGLYTDNPEPTVLFIVNNIEKGSEQRLKSVIDEALAETAEVGFDEEYLDAAFASLERSQLLVPMSEGNKGIAIINSVNDYWAYSGSILGYFENIDFMTSLDEDTLNDNLKDVIKRYLVSPETSAFTVNEPDPGYTARNDAALREKLANKKAQMSDEEIAAIVDRTINPPKQDTKLIAKLVSEINVSTVDNLREELENYRTKEYPYEDVTWDGVRYLTASVETEGIGDARIYLDISGLSDEQLLYLGLFDELTGFLDTTNYDDTEIYNKMVRYIYGGSKFIPTEDDTLYMTQEFIMLNDDIEETYNTYYELMYETQFDDTEYIKSVVDSDLADWETSPVDYGLLISRAQAQNNKKEAYYSYMEGLDYYNFLKDVSKRLEANPGEVTEQLEAVQTALRNRSNASIIFVGNDEGAELNNRYAREFFAKLDSVEQEKPQRNIPVPEGSEAIVTTTDVNYNLELAPLDMLGVGRDGALFVTQNYVNDKYLIPYLRIEKGAYGVTLGLNEYGMYISSYRDPQIMTTFEMYNKLGGLLKNENLTQAEIDGYILSTFTEKASKSSDFMGAWDFLRKKVYNSEKDGYELLSEILETTPEQVKSYAEVYNKLSENGIRGTVGREADIIANAGLYDKIIYPFAKDGDTIKIFFDGKRIETDADPVIVNDRTLVPLRAIFEAMGCDVDWSQDEEKIIVTRDDISVVLYIGSDMMTANGEEITLDAPPEIMNERTMVPVRAISEAVNCVVDWSEAARSVIIASN